jgi:hypothetical protein
MSYLLYRSSATCKGDVLSGGRLTIIMHALHAHGQPEVGVGPYCPGRAARPNSHMPSTPGPLHIFSYKPHAPGFCSAN